MTSPANQKATDAQILEALAQYPTKAAAAHALGLARRTFFGRVAKLAGAGVAIKPAPDGFSTKKVSTLYDREGNQLLQWVKADRDAERQKSLLEAIAETFKDVPKFGRIKAPRIFNRDLLTVLPMGDPHIGMYAWAAETGTDFDLEIAERDLVTATRRLVAMSPASEHALIVNLGDFYHADNYRNVTTRSGHVLDVDTRWPKVLRVGVQAMRACVDAALEKHKNVHVINEIGNHDDCSSQMLTLCLQMAYEKNPRVTFDDSPAKFHYYRFGRVMIGTTHTDTVKPEALGGIMATDRPEDWGATAFRYWYGGHIHTKRVVELPGCLVENFRTLAGRDAWTAAAGYRAGRDMNAIIMHKDQGEVERYRVDVSTLQQRAA